VRFTFRKHPIQNPQDLDGFEEWGRRELPPALSWPPLFVLCVVWSRGGVRSRRTEEWAGPSKGGTPPTLPSDTQEVSPHKHWSNSPVRPLTRRATSLDRGGIPWSLPPACLVVAKRVRSG
jgi:hypothetical protein